jgi:CO dehydrogenase nickel-insertion accessory protein CooC1
VLLIVVDSNFKSLEIAKHIYDLASEAGMKQLYLVGNRVMNDAQKVSIQSFADKNGLRVLDFIPFDTKITESDMVGKTPLLNKDFLSVKTIDNICEFLLKEYVV